VACVLHVAHAGRAPGGAGLSGRRCHGPTTGGARADRVGAKLPSRCSSELRTGGAVWARWRHPPPHGRPLAREHSAVVVWKPGRRRATACSRVAGRAGPARALCAEGRPARAGPLPARGVGTRPWWQRSERRRRATFTALSGVREIGGCARGSFWLQKSTSGARSMPSGVGLAPMPYAREGNLPARFCFTQRVLLRAKG